MIARGIFRIFHRRRLSGLRLAGQTIDVWAAALDTPQAIVEALERTLSADERERGERFVFARHRRRFVVARGALRMLLGGYTGLHPASVRLRYEERGKPALAAARAQPLHFNLSHSHEQVLIAITSIGPLGVDVERVREVRDARALASRFFSGAESAALERIEERSRDEAFFRCWTRKEAFVKAVGGGLSVGLDRFDVTLAADEPARLLVIDGSAQKASAWSLQHLDPSPGYLGALAIEHRACRLECRTLDLQQLDLD